MAAVTRLGLYGGPRRAYGSFAAAGASVAVSGTAVSGGVLESEIVAGGETIILTVSNDTWVADDGTFASIRQDIIDGLDSAGAEVFGWNAEVRDKLDVSAVVRTSDTVVTITLTAAAAYAIDSDETITVTVPASSLTTSSSDVTGQQTFTVTAQAEATASQGATGGGAFYWFENKRAYKKLDTTYRDELRRLWEELEEAPRDIRREAAEVVIVAQKRAQDRPETLPQRVRFPKFSDVNWGAVLQVVSINILRDLAVRAARQEEEDEDDFLLLH